MHRLRDLHSGASTGIRAHMNDFEKRVAEWMERYGVGRAPVVDLGLERLERMGEEARAFLLRDMHRHGVRQPPACGAWQPAGVTSSSNSGRWASHAKSAVRRAPRRGRSASLL